LQRSFLSQPLFLAKFLLGAKKKFATTVDAEMDAGCCYVTRLKLSNNPAILPVTTASRYACHAPNIIFFYCVGGGREFSVLESEPKVCNNKSYYCLLYLSFCCLLFHICMMVCNTTEDKQQFCHCLE
jgi:hypothetical protein